MQPAAPTGLMRGPLGAAGLAPLFQYSPRLSDVSYIPNNATLKLNAGMFYSAVGSPAALTEVDGMLTCLYDPVGPLNGTVSSQSHISQQNGTPYLSAAAPFYVEFETRILAADPNDPDHFCGTWIEPKEHNLKKDDQVAGMPAGFEAWVEVDVDEGGNAGGLVLSSFLSWSGIFSATGPSYKVTTRNNAGHGIKVDRSQFNRFGFRYDPAAQIARYYLNDNNHTTMSAAPINPAHHYYLVLDVASRGAKKPYQMQIKSLAAWQ
jgi:hypothetical protein